MSTEQASVILYGPSGSGKTRNAHRIMHALGLSKIVDGWTATQDTFVEPTGVLYVTNCNESIHHAMIKCQPNPKLISINSIQAQKLIKKYEVEKTLTVTKMQEQMNESVWSCNQCGWIGPASICVPNEHEHGDDICPNCETSDLNHHMPEVQV